MPDALTASTPCQSALSLLAEAFAQAGIASPALDARVLLCAAASLDHAALLRDPDRPLGTAAAAATAYARRRLAGEPVARILGRREFWSLMLAVTPDVLDPRADSETLVEAALAEMTGQRDRPLRLLDLGTGSGCLLAALLTEWPHASGLGIDRSAAACAVARRNLAALGLADRAQVLCADWSAALSPAARFDLVVSNPPYIETAGIAGLADEVRRHDPFGALDGGADGLDCYRQIVALLSGLLNPDGRAILELGQGQGPEVSALAVSAGLDVVRLWRDLAGIERALVLRRGC